MSDFINTIDLLGDDVVMDSIIDRSITEFKDDVITTVGHSAFRNCTSLTSVNLPKVTALIALNFFNCSSLTSIYLPELTSCGDSIFSGCPLEGILDFPKLTKINGNWFIRGSKITALVLRSGTMCTLTSTNTLGESPISRGTGYVYVPASLVETYKANSIWANYSSQIRALEDYTVDGTITGELDESKI